MPESIATTNSSPHPFARARSLKMGSISIDAAGAVASRPPCEETTTPLTLGAHRRIASTTSGFITPLMR